MDALFLLAAAAALALFALGAALRTRDFLAEGDVGLLAVDGVRALVCAAGAVALVALAIGRLA